MQTDDVVWVTAEANMPKNARSPRWMLSAGYSAGEVFVPAAVGGNENQVALCAMHDGVALITCWKHVYVPATWAKREFPKEADVIELIERRVQERLGV